MRSSGMSSCFGLCSGTRRSSKRGLNTIAIRPALLNLPVEAIEEGKVLPTAMADDQRGNPPPLLSLLQRQAHGVCQLAFARFQTITPVPSSAFSKKAARIGAAKLGSSSFTAR